MGPYCCRPTKLAGVGSRCIRRQNVANGMPFLLKLVLKAVVCWHRQLREEADRNNALCVPEKHEHRIPPR